jgi:hypothetical protein
MDLAKILLDKFFGFVAALIPGFFLLLVVVLHHGDLWRQLWDLNYLGYETKVAIVVFAAFIAGVTVSSFAGAAIGGFIGGLSAYKGAKAAQAAARASAADTQVSDTDPGPPQPIPLWRDANWRKLLTAYLGNAAPDDLQPIGDQNDYNQLIRFAKALPDADQQQAAFAAIQQRQFNEQLWMDWWNRLYRLTLQKNDPKMLIGLTLDGNIGSACLIILLSAPFTPILRQWWIVLPSIIWVLISAAQTYKQYYDATNPTESFIKQMEYLQMHVGKGESGGGKDGQD